MVEFLISSPESAATCDGIEESSLSELISSQAKSLWESFAGEIPERDTISSAEEMAFSGSGMENCIEIRK
jgi:hypothetical protein